MTIKYLIQEWMLETSRRLFAHEMVTTRVVAKPKRSYDGRGTNQLIVMDD
jgi:hypothetical protein